MKEKLKEQLDLMHEELEYYYKKYLEAERTFNKEVEEYWLGKWSVLHKWVSKIEEVYRYEEL